MSKWQRIKYRLACKLMGFDIYGANAVARQQGYRQGYAEGMVAERMKRND
jgi:hypothetical protein